MLMDSLLEKTAIFQNSRFLIQVWPNKQIMNGYVVVMMFGFLTTIGFHLTLMHFSRLYDVSSCIYTNTVWNLNNYEEI